MDKLGKIRQLRGKERLKIGKNAKFEIDLLKSNGSSKSRNFKDICMVRGTNLPPTLQSSVNFRNIAKLYLRLLKTRHFQNLAF